LKSFNNEPRPFFVYDLQPYKCRLEHGDPSGHTFIVTSLYGSLIEMLIREYSGVRKHKNSARTTFIVFVLFIGFGRVYNGVHTYN